MAAHDVLARGGRKALEIIVLVSGTVAMTAVTLDTIHGAEQPAAQNAAPERELIPGAERLTAAERDAYRRRMEAATTAEDKARIRAEYVKVAEKSAEAPALVGDPNRGANLHSACFSCHGIERYTAPITFATASFFDSVLRAGGLSELPPPPEPRNFKGSIRSLDALRAAVMRRNELFSPKMTPQEVEDVVAYLNVTYYKFPQQLARAPEK